MSMCPFENDLDKTVRHIWERQIIQQQAKQRSKVTIGYNLVVMSHFEKKNMLN